jgi:hypothetical protein
MLTDSQKEELADEIARATALEHLKSEPEFRQVPAQRFVNFDPTPPPTYISADEGPAEWRKDMAACADRSR